MSRHIEIYCNGCALNNGKENAVATYAVAMIVLDDGKVAHQKLISGLCDPVCSTNNYAEITAILEGLKCIKLESRALRTVVKTTSQYVVNAISGAWEIKTNADKFAELRDLMNTFKDISVEWTPRKSWNIYNEKSDEMALNAAIAYAEDNGISYRLFEKRG